MPTRLKDKERRMADTKARVEKHRTKLYSNPERLEEYRRKERERYQKRKRDGLLKSVTNMTPKEKSQQQYKWRENSRKFYERKKQTQAILELTPPSIIDEQENPIVQEQPHSPHRILSPVIHNMQQPQTPQTSTPKRKTKTMSKLRDKIRNSERRIEEKEKHIDRLRKKMKRMQMMNKINQGRRREAQEIIRGHTVSQRRKMGDIIKKFLHRDDVTTVINGKAGEVRRNGQVFRKRFLTDTMGNLHKKFLRENPNLKISRAQFFKHRPFWVVSPKVTDRETCACKIHENFGSRVKKLYQLGIINKSHVSDLVASAVCDKSSMECMYKRCNKCKELMFPMAVDPNTKGDVVSWSEWVSRSTPFTKKQNDGSKKECEIKVMILEKRFATIEKLVLLTQEDLPRFCTHVYNIGHQFDRLNALKERMDGDEAVVHVDYSENYTCKWHREVKDAHFGGSHQQVTLHTGVIYLNGGRFECFASISACLRHDAVATWAHLDPVLDHIRATCESVKTVHFISDGPTSQYRNKTSFYLASTVPFMKGFRKVTWNFTEASHGKGAPDGVGGALKNLADRMVAHGTDIDNVDVLMQNLSEQSSVRLFAITEDKITASGELVPPSLKTVQGTMKIHQLIATEAGKIKTREVSCFCPGVQVCDCYNPKSFVFMESEKESEEDANQETGIEVGNWVLVEYDSELFPGTVTQISGEQYEVDTMSRAGENRFFVPAMKFPGDKIWYYESDIKDRIPEPLPATSSARHFCVLPEIWAKHTKKRA